MRRTPQARMGLPLALARLSLPLALAWALAGAGAQAAPPDTGTGPPAPPTRALGPERLQVQPGAALALFSSAPLAQAHPAVREVLVVLHGHGGNAKTYFDIGRQAAGLAQADPASTLVIAPQFPTAADLAAGAERASVLRWRASGWESGGAAAAPARITAFAALDALMRQLANPALFPALERVVIAGHSGGAQLAQRYAIGGSADALLAGRHVALRYVVANASSYAWFHSERPQADVARACPDTERWKYGMQGRPAPLDRLDPGSLEQAYAQRDVVYLFGGQDTDPNHPALDKRCAAEAQGNNRLARGQAFLAALRQAQGAATHRAAVVPGVGHDAKRMFTSACGLAALFDRAGCPALTRP